MDVIAAAFGGLVAVVLFATLVFVVAQITHRRHDVIDAMWGLFFIVNVLIVAMQAPKMTPVAAVVVGMVVVWGLRLWLHIFGRWKRASVEDPRYQQLRKNWPQRYMPLQVYTRIYLVQALLVAIISLPVTLLVRQSPGANGVVIIGMAIWLAGFVVEVVADWQLRQFAADPAHRGMTMQSGLWRYSRHPNYFGEITMWWGLAIAALTVRWGWIGILGAATISYLIVFVSGIPPAERGSRRRKGWDEYRQRTSVLMLWPPRARPSS